MVDTSQQILQAVGDLSSIEAKRFGDLMNAVATLQERQNMIAVRLDAIIAWKAEMETAMKAKT
jgi:hypothetical protein